MKTATKPGKYGTLYRYVIRYRDPDPTCPIFDWPCWAYDAEHAQMKFTDMSAYDGWEDAVIVSVQRAREGAAS